MNRIERAKAVVEIIGYVLENLHTATERALAEEVIRRLDVMCDRCEALRSEPTAYLGDCPCACPGTEWRKGQGLA